MISHLTNTDVEKQPKTLATDPTVLADRKVQAAQKKLDRLIAANAAGPVIARAQRVLDDARLDVQERAAVKNAATRAKALAANREELRLRKERETIFRMGPMAPAVGLIFAGLRVNAYPERANDPTLRGFVWGDWHRVCQIVMHEFERAAGIASRATTPPLNLPVDTHRFRALVEDAARRSMKHGLLTVEEV
ncbi:MAG TPA: hypothetical protein VFE48_22385 [Methylomirabilota bacterium]|nr:hypothetical protein [Methylomirabilota bacterium]